MREILLVLAREFDERVRTRAFAVGTLLFPLFIAAILLLPTLTGAPRERRLVVVDEAPEPIGAAFVQALNRSVQPADSPQPSASAAHGGGQYRVERVSGPLEPLRAELSRRIDAEEIDGYVVLPADVRETGRVQFRSTRVGDPSLIRDVHRAATEAVQADRLNRSGLQLDRIADLLQPVRVDGGRVTQQGADAGTAQAGFYFAYIVAMIIYLMIALYGSGVTRSVLEEKTNRIAEVLVSSLRAEDLMIGKILGVSCAVLLQVGIWVLAIGLMITQSSWLATRFNIDPAMLNAIAAQPGTAALLLGYFILGFIFFAALFAALGAAVTTDQEAQSYQMLIMVPLFVPLLFLMQLTTQPMEPLARTLGMIPLTAPVAMPMRIAAAPVPTAEVLLSLGLLLAATLCAAWIGARIYRIGILATGKRPGLRELGRWLTRG